MFRKIALNSIISFSARIIAVALGFFSLGLTTRLLGPQGFGLYSTALTWAYLGSFLADLGLYSLMVREVGRYEDKEEKQMVSHIFSLRLVSLFLFLGVGIGVAILSPWKFGLSITAITLASLQYLSLSLSQLLMALFQKYLRMGIPALAEVFGRILIVAGLLYLFFIKESGEDYHVVLGLFSLGALIAFVFNLFGARRLVSFHAAFSRSQWKYLLSQTFPLAASLVFSALYFKLDTLFIAFFRGQVEVGLYNAAYKILENAIFFPAMFVGILMPQLSKFALIDKERFKSIFQGAFDILLLITPALTLGIFFEAEQIMRLIAGKDFLTSTFALEILSFGMFMIFFGSLFSNALIALHLQKSLAWIYFTGAVFSISANFFIVPIWGYIGAAVTTLLTEALVTILMIHKIEGFVLGHLSFSRVLPVFLASASMSIFFYFSYLPLLLSIGGGFILYITILFATGGITKADINMIFETGPL